MAGAAVCLMDRAAQGPAGAPISQPVLDTSAHEQAQSAPGNQRSEQSVLAAGAALTAPPRNSHGLVLVKPALTWTYNCMECHKVLTARWHYDRPMAEHQHIQLKHGGNRFCLNCHHPTNRNAFVDYDGAEIAEADVASLCAKCHGPTYRDWQAGVHGRRNGYWDAVKGPQTRLQCIQCHDPHNPKFQSMKPLAPLRYPGRASNSPARQTAAHPPHP